MIRGDLLIDLAVTAPWHLALLIAAVVAVLRCRDRRAAGLAAAGLLVVLAGESAWATNLHIWLRDVGLLRSVEESESAFRVIDAAYRYAVPAGFGLLLAAAFLGRPVTAPRSPRRSSCATGPR